MSTPGMVKLKICGIKSAGEARAVHDLPIDYLGLNFIPISTRYITLETARAIMAEIGQSKVKTVALFAGQPLDEVNDHIRRLGVDFVQLHGDEPAGYAQAVNAPVMRAIAVDPEQPAEELLDFIDHYPADYFVLDRQLQGRGQAVDLDLAAQVIKGTNKQLFFAGGLTPANLGETLAKITPFGIDIAGGVRTGDHLDVAKVQNCLEILRSRLTSAD